MKKRYVPIAVVLTFVAIQVAVVTLKIDFWPFSNYPMFSEKRDMKEGGGAFQLQIVRRSGEVLSANLDGPKFVWKAYQDFREKLSSTGTPGPEDARAVENQMREDLRNYLAQTSDVRIDDLKEVRAVLVSARKVEEGQPIVESVQVLHVLNLMNM